MSGSAPVSRSGEVVGGKYRVLRVLAEGGMGVVYEAQHVVVKRRFAIKFLRPDFADRREILARFHREAQTAGALESENIAAAIDFGILGDGTPYIVMEYLVGESLGSLLAREEHLPVERATDLCLQACRGIESAHASGIVHRDLKPENLFVCRRDDGTDLIKVLDFGIAKLEQMETNSAATRTGTILGTPAYMSPEQARGDRTIDHRTDVYGLGAILFEMLSGKKPHPGDSHNAILHHISTQPALPLHSVQPDLPLPLLEAVERALASDPNRRHASAEALGQALAPFAKRTVWPAATEYGSGSGANETSSTPGGRLARSPEPPEGRVDADGSTIAAAGQPSPPRRGPRTAIAVGAGLVATIAIVTVIVIVPGRSPHPPTTVSPPRTMGDRPLPRDTKFFVPPPMPGAVQQIAALVKQKAFADAAPLTAMAATPQAVWFIGGTPDDVRSAVQNTMVRAAPDRRVPVLVANNIPFRDCAQYSAGGATSTAAYQAWIDGFANGIGNGRAVVILEPDSLGIIPYNTAIDGSPDWCKPTIADAQGRTIPAPGAAPADRYAQINHAVDSIVARAPNASVYLDGTHAGWLSVGEIAQRLVKAGVQRAQGFFVNLSNFQPTPQSIQYGTWISKCIYYANNPAEGGRRLGRYADCTSQYSPANADDHSTWGLTEKWYVDNVDHAPNPPARASALTHFVIDTSRNGRGTLDVPRYAAAPYNQPVEVLKGLKRGDWCNPPNAGLGLRPSADTGVPLVDAFLWVKIPGGSDGSCDIAGGARAWDYARYNPWGIGGDAENHFDPLWGAVDPAAGEWFADEALQLAHNATPPLQAAPPASSRAQDDEERSNEGSRGRLGAAIAATMDSQPSASGTHPAAQTKRAASPPASPSGRPLGRPPPRPGPDVRTGPVAQRGAPRPRFLPRQRPQPHRDRRMSHSIRRTRTAIRMAPRVLVDSHRVPVSCISSIVLLAASWAGAARAADEAPVDARETARLHYAHGLELAGQAEYEAALREFTAAYTVSPHYAVLYNIGQAYVALGRPAEAIENLSKYLREGQDQVPPARRQEVQSQITLLESLFAELTVITDRPGALITIDGREVGRTPLYQSVRLPAGTHRVFATLATMVIDRTVTLANGEHQILNLELPSASPTAAVIAESRPPAAPVVPSVASDVRLQPAPASLPSPTRDKQPETGTPGWRTKSVVGYAAVGVGAAFAGAASGVFLWNRDRYQRWQANDAALRRDAGAIDYHTRQVANNQLADSLTKANHLILGFSVVGGLALAGGVTLLVLDRIRGRTTEEAPGSATTGISLGWGSQGPASGSISWSASW